MKQSGYYGYIKPNTNIKTKYTIEFTRNKKVFDSMEKASFTFDMLDKREFDYLQDAINLYNVLFHDESVLHIMLFEQVILNNEIILEQCKDMMSTNFLAQETQKQINRVNSINEGLQEENNKYKKFINSYNADELYSKWESRNDNKI